MANDAANMQLSIVARPKMVWPGLDKAGLRLQPIAGDGNCLYASLSHQLYGTPDRHMEIRATIVQHMREYKPLYEAFVNAGDVIQKRATRATTNAVRKQTETDAYEGYLTSMSRFGSYGGQPELQAFVRAYNQDVMVHLPPSSGYKDLSMPYTWEDRDPSLPVNPPLHICFGGDEVSNGHYDSSQRSDGEENSRSLATRLKPATPQITQTGEHNHGLTPRAMRGMKSDPQSDMMHELVTAKGARSVRASMDDRRARSPSVDSSHYSTSSKRSHDDDSGPSRAAKRIDRRQRSLRQTAAEKLSQSPRLMVPASLSHPASSGPPTPTSSQDTDSSSEQPEDQPRPILQKRAHGVIEIEDSEDESVPLPAARTVPQPSALSSSSQDCSTTTTPHIVMEQPARTTLRL